MLITQLVLIFGSLLLGPISAEYYYLTNNHQWISEDYSQGRHVMGLVGPELVQPISYQYTTQATPTPAPKNHNALTTKNLPPKLAQQQQKPSQQTYVNWNALAPSGGVKYFSKSSAAAAYSSPTKSSSNVATVRPSQTYDSDSDDDEMPTYHDESPNLIGQNSEIGYRQQLPPASTKNVHYPSSYVVTSPPSPIPYTTQYINPPSAYSGYPESYHSNRYHNGRADGVSSSSGGNFHRPAQAAVISTHHVHYYDVPSSSQHNPKPTTIEVGATTVPLRILLRSRSSPLNIEQIHESAGGSFRKTESEDLPHTLRHTVIKPIVQELYEMIKPYRIIRQEMKPVQEVIETIVARDMRKHQQEQAKQLPKNIPQTYDKRVQTDGSGHLGINHLEQIPINHHHHRPNHHQHRQPVIQQQEHEQFEQQQQQLITDPHFESQVLPPSVKSRQLLEQIGSDYIAASSNSLFTGLYGSPAMASVTSSLSSPFFYYPSEDVEYSDNNEDDEPPEVANNNSEQQQQQQQSLAQERRDNGDDEYGGKIGKIEIQNDNFGRRIQNLRSQNLEQPEDEVDYEDDVEQDDQEPVTEPSPPVVTQITQTVNKIQPIAAQLAQRRPNNNRLTVKEFMQRSSSSNRLMSLATPTTVRPITTTFRPKSTKTQRFNQSEKPTTQRFTSITPTTSTSTTATPPKLLFRLPKRRQIVNQRNRQQKTI